MGIESRHHETTGKPPVRRQIGEVFPVFSPETTTFERVTPYMPELVNYVSRFVLSDPRLPAIPMEISAVLQDRKKGEVFTPFTPELGSRVKTSDLNIFDRIKDFRQRVQELRQPVPRKQAPLMILVVGNDNRPLPQVGNLPHRVKGQLLLRRLALQLDFLGRTFEARAQRGALRRGVLSFSDFYPVDIGPLPIDHRFSEVQRGELREGLGLQIPEVMPEGTPEGVPSFALENITARFVVRNAREGGVVDRYLSHP